VVTELGYGLLLLTVAILTIVSLAISFMILKYLRVDISDSERRVLMLTGNTRGVLGFTLALQNFNPCISAAVVVFNVIHTMIFEPLFNFYLVTCVLSYTDYEPHYLGKVKQAVLNLHKEKLAQWLTKDHSSS